MDPKKEIQLNSDLIRIAVCIMQAVFFFLNFVPRKGEKIHFSMNY